MVSIRWKGHSIIKDDVGNLLGDDIRTIERNAEVLLNSCKDIGLAVNTGKGLGLGLGLMGRSLLPNALLPFNIYCAPPSIISQLVLILWQTVEIDLLGHVRVVEALQNFVQKRDPLILSEIHIHIAGVQQVSLALRHLLHKGFMSFPILYR